MRILSCIWRTYYWDPVAVNPNYYYFVELPRRMGHQAFLFDHVDQARLNKDAMNDLFLALIRGGRYDVVFIETLSDEFYPAVLDEAKKHTITVAFNADDDFRWLEYSSQWSSHYTFMMTTYRHIYELAKLQHPNLLLGQWACGKFFDGINTTKDIAVSFVGGIHADRACRFEELRQYVPLELYGRGTLAEQATWQNLARIFLHRLRGGRGNKKALRDWMLQRLRAMPDSIAFAEANNLWNRTRIAFTPLNLSEAQFQKKLEMARHFGKEKTSGWNPWISPMQIKGRIFEMGLSGSLMVCDRNPAIDEFYTRGKEYEDFESLAECVDKLKFYLANESERRQIAQAYYDRTCREHLWEHRFRQLFDKIGIRTG